MPNYVTRDPKYPAVTPDGRYIITEEMVTTAMKMAVAEKGADFALAAGCIYQAPNGKPICIVGAALSKIQIDSHHTALDMLRDDPTWLNWGRFASQTPTLLTFDRRTTQALQAAQSAQDGQETWGMALAVYLDWLEDHPA